jgi:hypothetical protein
MTEPIFAGPDAIDRALRLLGAVLDRDGAPATDIVVVGGAALSMLGFVVRPTRDVDTLAVSEGPSDGLRLQRVSELPELLRAAVAEVAEAAALPQDWLNPGPTALLDHGMPEGFEERLVPEGYGTCLTVHYASRPDLIAMKVYAAADTGPGRHTDDLSALDSNCEELLGGARWARTHDSSPSFLGELRAVLLFMGCPDAAERLADE